MKGRTIFHFMAFDGLRGPVLHKSIVMPLIVNMVHFKKTKPQVTFLTKEAPKMAPDKAYNQKKSIPFIPKNKGKYKYMYSFKRSHFMTMLRDEIIQNT